MVFTPVQRTIAQSDTLVDQIYAVLILDSLTITAGQNEPDIKTMISQTIHDTTFYRAFQRLRRVPFAFTSELYFFNPDWVPHTYMRSKRIQHIHEGMRTNEIIEETIHRDLIDSKGRYRFYTAQMYDRLFLTDDPTPVPTRWVNDPGDLAVPDSRMEKYIQDLKKLLFAPGSRIDLPLMGDKTAIFDEDQREKYQYKLFLDTISFPSPVYKFQITSNPEISDKATIIKELTTVFDQESKQVLNRSYQLAYQTLLYQFDVSMFIAVRPTTHGYLPTKITYKGWWNIPFKKPEWCQFSFRIDDQ